MLSEELKQRIREAYNATVASRGLLPRWGQRQMIAEVANTLARIPAADNADAEDGPPVCVIEAGTGTGKTIAYSIPAIVLAAARNKRLLVATATVALQEQFIYQDLPAIRQGSGLEFSVALAKGRRRYVCLSKLDRVLAQGQQQDALLPLYPDEQPGAELAAALPRYQSMLDALSSGEWDGDRDNWPHTTDESLWQAVTTDHSQCTGRRCPHIRQCSFFRAREAAQDADVIVANHDLVLSDLALGGGAILPAPEDTIYVFDEGHHLPDKALGHFSSFCRLHSTRQWLQDCRKAIIQAAEPLAPLSGTQGLLLDLPQRVETLAAELQLAEEEVAELFENSAGRSGREEECLRFAHGCVPDPLRERAGMLAEGFSSLVSALEQLEARLQDALDADGAGVEPGLLEEWHLAVAGMRSRGGSTLMLWQDFAVDAAREEPPRARWINAVHSGGALQGFDLLCSPILADGILDECLWSRAAGVVVTSATITALGSFERFRQRAGVPADARYKVVASPFDYQRAVLSVPDMRADPGDVQGHTAELVRLLPVLLEEESAALVLFASRRQMNDVCEQLPEPLASRLLVQDRLGKQEILRRHREAVDAGRPSVILGLASFAEGVDLPGPYCRHVVIAKIPFAVPDSPLEAALAEWFERQGRDPFLEISVPDAALRLVQASGRLLRTESDEGRVTLCDRRLLTRRYGRAILDSLPPFRRELGALRQNP